MLRRTLFVAYSIPHRHPMKFDVLLVAGPSGVGKGTVINMLMDRYPQYFAKCLSSTTRQPRVGEVNGVHYHFTTKDKMREGIARGEYIENDVVHGELYGTAKSSLRNTLDSGKVCVFDLSPHGVENIVQQREALDIKTHSVFLLPVSWEHLERRLRDRHTETEEKVLIRMKTARDELDFYEKHKTLFDEVYVNEKSLVTCDKLCKYFGLEKEVPVTKKYVFPGEEKSTAPAPAPVAARAGEGRMQEVD